MMIQETNDTRKAIVLVALALVIAGCSNRELFDAAQHNQRLNCQKLPQSQYQECMKRASRSYEEYQSAREEVLAGG